MTRRRHLLTAVTLGSPLPTRAQETRVQEAGRPVRLVVPWSPGGSTDIVARQFVGPWSARLGQTVVIENRAGASGTIGHAAVAGAPADGTVVLMGTNSTYAIAPALHRNLPYEHERAFAPVTLLAQGPLVLCIHAGVPATDMRAFVALARARPGALNIGNGGNGSTSHLAGELLMALAGVELTQVGYRGSGQTVQAVSSGEVQAGFLAPTTARPLAEAGLLRVIGVTGTGRSAALPLVPPIAEAGIPQFETTTAYALFVPRATPAPVIARLHEAAAAALAEPALRERLAGEDIEVVGAGPEALAAHVRAETARWGEIIRSRNIVAN